jgi:hypothetical protein
MILTKMWLNLAARQVQRVDDRLMRDSHPAVQVCQYPRRPRCIPQNRQPIGDHCGSSRDIQAGGPGKIHLPKIVRYRIGFGLPRTTRNSWNRPSSVFFNSLPGSNVVRFAPFGKSGANISNQRGNLVRQVFQILVPLDRFIAE